MVANAENGILPSSIALKNNFLLHLHTSKGVYVSLINIGSKLPMTVAGCPFTCIHLRKSKGSPGSIAPIRAKALPIMLSLKSAKLTNGDPTTSAINNFITYFRTPCTVKDVCVTPRSSIPVNLYLSVMVKLPSGPQVNAPSSYPKLKNICSTPSKVFRDD